MAPSPSFSPPDQPTHRADTKKSRRFFSAAVLYNDRIGMPTSIA
ncbi:hypothetical protein HMPREF7545_0192 [Selenomonas noxia ATCC 43541]|nr:hypothetical protein HMPREF7545_0192 [Selenomonas noxia ATCC 43541]